MRKQVVGEWSIPMNSWVLASAPGVQWHGELLCPYCSMVPYPCHLSSFNTPLLSHSLWLKETSAVIAWFLVSNAQGFNVHPCYMEWCKRSEGRLKSLQGNARFAPCELKARETPTAIKFCDEFFMMNGINATFDLSFPIIIAVGVWRNASARPMIACGLSLIITVGRQAKLFKGIEH